MPVNLEPKVTDLGEFSVARVLPNRSKRMVGPFVFFDHMGPVEFQPGQGVNVRPHPHIGLATLTYLLKGHILHRDSLGNCCEIAPGDVNWMVAGKGVTHSERETLETHGSPHFLDGLQCWVALPREQAEIAPSFNHVSRFDLPHYMHKGMTARLVIGQAYGMASPLTVYSPMFMVDIQAHDSTTVERPNPDHECVLYLAQGSVTINGESVDQGATVLLEHDDEIKSELYSRLILFGGEKWNDVPHLEWNFVSFERSRIEQAKQDWREGKFPNVVGDNAERIPLPD